MVMTTMTTMIELAQAKSRGQGRTSVRALDDLPMFARLRGSGQAALEATP